MELLEGIKNRRSIRGFKPTPIPEETIRNILEAAKKSPSTSNTQPWQVAVVTGKKKEELSKILCDLAKSGASEKSDMSSTDNWPPEMEQRFREHSANRFKTLGIDRADQEQRLELRLRGLQFFGAPCALFLFMDGALGMSSFFDMGLFAQSLVLAAHASGLGACLQLALTGYSEAVRDFLGLPATKKLIIGISMGYPDPEAKLNTYHSTRIGVDDFVHWYA
ncbi:MAG: nitroreductase [Dehalococcoidales bacterium]|nr:nitroreductase [Dehalococcoidales bacterium]MDZ4230266.1 nitroreductase [Dehalococcoidales bacterium]